VDAADAKDPFAGYPPNTVAVFDLDGTLARRDTFLGILLHSLKLNPTRLPRLVRLGPPTLRFKRGRLDNTTLKTLYLETLLADLSQPAIRRLTDSFLERVLPSGLRRGGLDTLRRHRSAGHTTVLLTASPDFYVGELARRLEFDECLCTLTARRADGTLTGELASKNCQGPEKLARLMHWFGGPLDGSFFVGYGDHRKDFHLLTRLDKGYLVNPDQSLRSLAGREGLSVLYWP